MKGILIAYDSKSSYTAGHPDPVFEELTYGDSDQKGKRLQKYLKKGDYMFFWTNISGRQYVTAYYVVEKVVPTRDMINNKHARLRYRNPHLHPERYGQPRKWRTDPNDTLVFGHKRMSRKLGIPLQLTKSIVQHLSKPVPFREDRTETENIGSGLKTPKDLTDADVGFLLEQIQRNNTIGEFPLAIAGWREEEIADILEKNPSFLEPGMMFLGREVGTASGHIDLLFENTDGALTVVEVKDETADSVDQVIDYRRATEEKHPGRKVRGAIVCPDATPRLMRNAEQSQITIYLYKGRFWIDRI